MSGGLTLRCTRRIAGGAIESYAAWGIMTLWMRAQRTALLHPLYSIDQLNHYPLGIAGVAILALFVTVGLASRTDWRPLATGRPQ